MRKNKQKPKKMFFIYTKDFFNHLRSELHSERTIETYCQSLNAFRIYLYETYSKTIDQITIDFVTEEVIREFLSSVADSNSVGTRNVRLSGIKAYLKYAATRDMELVPLQISISAVKHKKTYPKRHNWLDKADIELILAQPPQTKIGIRDRFIILFLFSTGARLAEMRSVQLKDVIINEKYPYIRITGKGNKPRIVPIPEDSFLKNYKYYCHLYHPKENPDDYLFYPTAKGGREMMSEDNVQRILKKYGDAARCSNPKLPSIHPHLLRHSYGAQLYRLGVSLPEISKLLGHEDISTTEIYAETDPEMAAEAISKMLGKQPVRKWDFLTEDEKLKILGLK